MLDAAFGPDGRAHRGLDDPLQPKKSAEDCALCSLIWDVMRADETLMQQLLKYNDHTFNPTGLYYDDGVSDVDEYIAPTKSVTFDIHLWSVPEPKDGTNGSFVLMMSLHAEFATRLIRRHGGSRHLEQAFIAFVKPAVPEIPGNPSGATDPRPEGDQKFALIDSWLRRDTNRPDLIANDGFLPSRLLEICDNGIIKLVNTSTATDDSDGKQQQPNPHQKYVALSHRWGISQHFTTTKATIPTREQGFHQDELPATYKDAVTTARNLGFSHLWIDSLCIVQDDEADWKSESQRMGNIFKHASFTIAAHCARGDDEGFLARALVKRGTVDHLHIHGGEQKTFSLYRRGNLAMDVTASALCRRGWVLQERFMASRTIHFTDGQVFAETTDTVLCEDGPLDFSANPTTTTTKPSYDILRGKRGRSGGVTATWSEDSTTFYSPSAAPALRAMFGLGSNSNTQQPTHTTDSWSESPPHLEDITVPMEWLDLVEMYTNCDLTKESDKLIAIAGMAREIQRQTSSIWAAGLWGSSNIFPPSLLWMQGSTKLRRPSITNPQRAPSWSWAAWDGPIQHPFAAREMTPCCRFLDVSQSQDTTTPIPSTDTPATGTAKTTWLDGPGILRLQTMLISFPQASIATTHTDIGPGPPPRGILAEVGGVKGIGLKSFIAVHALLGPQHTPLGWLCPDDGLVPGSKLPGFESSARMAALSPAQLRARQRVRSRCSWRLEDLRFVAVGWFRHADWLETSYLGVFVVPAGGGGGGGCYRRVGVGLVCAGYIWTPPAGDVVVERYYGKGFQKAERRTAEWVEEDQVVCLV
ncbi:heterokaryon incompatibility protein-domain-containing protein [Cercophora scortea]|uniref:Heterokaryon incompatibility protein-domain-containing protein n=1 Tax=Cercophora scortea TaxID=314031 RepID=A0AAE0MGS5_9PEZI|nr:heterokaryon incompatibility protein-domain-containing protein [Cercophora scortea]